MARQELEPLVGKLETAEASRCSVADRRALVAGLFAACVVLAGAIALLEVPTSGPVMEIDARYLCDPDTKQDSGYVKLANKENDHYFYWYSESRNAPATDPLVLWLTGGPGGSSILAMLAENGPCKILPGIATEVNSYSWTAQANVVWLDQPTNVGFSHGAPQDKDFNETNVGENTLWFLQGFLAKHPELQGREFFVTGESYGGHFVPVAAHYIWQHNRNATDAASAFGIQKINLQGIAIGNGLVNPAIQYLHSADMADNAYNISLLSPAQAHKMQTDSLECVELTHACQSTPRVGSTCVDAKGCWLDKLVAPYQALGRNQYDIRKPCHPDFPLCYNFTDVHEYLDSKRVRELLHVDPSIGPWQEMNLNVTDTFAVDGDWSMAFDMYVADLLNDGLRVLIYAGDADVLCNWQGNLGWTMTMDWDGKAGFNAAEERTFVTHDPLVNNAPAVNAGVLRMHKNLALVRVFNAGHMVPMDQPVVALELLSKFFANEAF